jgi:hypothetical protein
MPPSLSGPYECRFDKLAVVRNTLAGWQAAVTDKFNSSTDFRTFSVDVEPSPAPRVVVTSNGDPMRITGHFAAVELDAGHLSFQGEPAGYCRVIDANCAPTVQLFAVDASKAVASVAMSTYGHSGETRELANINLLFTCAHRWPGINQ